MKRTAKKLFVAVAVAAVTAQTAVPVSACGGRGGRVVRPSYGYATTVYRQPAPVYRQVAPVYHPVPYQQPVRIVQPAPATTVAAVQPKPRGLVAAQAAAAGNPNLQPQLNRATTVANPQGLNTGVGNTMTARRGNASAQPAAAAATALSNTASPATATPKTATPNATAGTDAESSALAALASLAAASAPAASSQPTAAATTPAAAPAVSPAAANGAAGVYRATLPSKVVIELRLNQEGTFSWSVLKNGSSTQFSGQYRVDQGRLTLVRSNDLQKMAGKLTAGQNGFNFKLDGANNAGLSFTRV